jgi:hypothetical protein
MLFMMFNATVVFAGTASRTISMIVLAVLVIYAVLRRVGGRRLDGKNAGAKPT